MLIIFKCFVQDPNIWRNWPVVHWNWCIIPFSHPCAFSVAQYLTSLSLSLWLTSLRLNQKTRMFVQNDDVNSRRNSAILRLSWLSTDLQSQGKNNSTQVSISQSKLMASGKLSNISQCQQKLKKRSSLAPFSISTESFWLLLTKWLCLL